MKKHKVTLRPDLRSVEIAEGESLLSALRTQDVYIKSSCGGVATCSDCIIKIVSGEEHLSPIEFAELKLLGNVYHITKERLACQTKITGDVTIDISGHNKSSDEKKLQKKTTNLRSTLRKKTVVEEVKEKREESKKEKREKDDKWFKHWEKNNEEGSTSRFQKRLGGGKRPRPFKYEPGEEE